MAPSPDTIILSIWLLSGAKNPFIRVSGGTTSDGTGSTYQAEDALAILSDNVTLHAKWNGESSNRRHRSTESTVIQTSSEPKAIMRFQIGQRNAYVSSGTSTEKAVEMSVSPIIIEQRSFLPIRYVLEPIGGTVEWNQALQKVTVTRGTTTIELWINSNTAKVNGIAKQIDQNNPNIKPTLIDPGRTMLPIRFISETLGLTVEWDQVAKEIVIKK